MARYLFDLESDGFLEQTTVIHSLVLKDDDTGEVYSYCDAYNRLEDGLLLLQRADEIIGHNIQAFDIPVIQKLYPWFTVDTVKVTDTLILSRLIYPDLKDKDLMFRAKGGELPSKLIGSHSLKAWGYRLKVYKGDFGETNDWSVWTPEMQAYCEQDVEVTNVLYETLTARMAPWGDCYASELEHRLAYIINEQEKKGFMFDVKAAEKLYVSLVQRRIELEDQLRATFQPWWVAGEVKTPKKTLNYKDPEKASRVADCSYTEAKLMFFNPASRDHIASRLIALRGWLPSEFTENGKPKVDEEVLGKLKYPEAVLLSEYLMLNKRIGQLAEGNQAWLKQAKGDRIHGRVITNGAVTGRATHSNPNVAQVPSVGSPYGNECRELFCVPSGRKLVGIDVSGLELRMLGHYMARYDNGAYAREVVDGDIHTVNQEAAGLTTRNDAKRFIYAFLYGAGPEKLANVTGKTSRSAGVAIKKKFLAKTPALAKLISAVQNAAENKKYLVGLDGRHLHIRSTHAALNTLLQSAGALVCKQWIVRFHELLHETGLASRVDQVAWVHDEIQLEVDAEIAEQVGEIAVKAIEDAGVFFDLRVPLTGEYKVGNNWKETH